MTAVTRRLAMFALAAASLLETPAAFAQRRAPYYPPDPTYERAAEQLRERFARGSERPGRADDPYEWGRGYDYGLRNEAAASARNSSWVNGWAAGHREYQRQVDAAQAEEQQRTEAAAERRKTLEAHYKDADAVSEYLRGFNDTESTPPETATEKVYVAYQDGFAAGQQAKAQAGKTVTNAATQDRGELVRTWRWERAQLLAARYIGHVNGMNLYATLLALLTEGGGLDMAKLHRTDLTVAESLAATEVARERAKRMLTAYTRFNEHAWAASQIQPLLIEAIETLVREDLGPDAASRKFDDHRVVLAMKAVDLSDFANSLREAPVTVPVNFDEMGRKLKEWIPVLDTVRKADTLRKALGAENFSQKALAHAYEEYRSFAKKWVNVHLSEWEKTGLTRLYTKYIAPSPTVAAEAVRFAGDFSTVPNETPAGGGAPGVVRVSYQASAGTAAVSQVEKPAASPTTPEPKGGPSSFRQFLLGVLALVAVLALAYLARFGWKVYFG